MVTDNRLMVSDRITPDTAQGCLNQCKAAGSATTQNASLFTGIANVIAQLASDTTAFDTAQSAAANKGKIETTTRDTKWKAAKKSYRAFVLSVQGLMDNAADEEHARQLAAAASLPVRDKPVRTKAATAAKALGNGVVKLSVKVPVKKGAKCFYEWRMSTDGGKSWVSLPGTNDSFTTVEGLTPSTEVQFSWRYTSNNVISAWTTGFPVIVH
jgi:hypothetical protein